jgi:hypothetical protein
VPDDPDGGKAHHLGGTLDGKAGVQGDGQFGRWLPGGSEEYGMFHWLLKQARRLKPKALVTREQASRRLDEVTADMERDYPTFEALEPVKLDTLMDRYKAGRGTVHRAKRSIQQARSKLTIDC